MNRIAPLGRIAFGLAAVTCSLLLLLDLVGLIPGAPQELAADRIRYVEGIVTQATVAATRRDMAGLRTTLELSVRRNDEVLSAGLRNRHGRILLATRDHAEHWQGAEQGRSTATHLRLPIFRDGKEWALLEVRYAALGPDTFWALVWQRPVVRLVLVMGVMGFISFAFYMRRTLRHLDPSSVIPPRVQNALDVMAEGVLLLDEQERVVLANKAFCSQVDRARGALLGTRPDTLDWRMVSGGVGNVAPWTECIRNQAGHADATMARGVKDEERLYQIKSSPVLDGWKRAKGAIVTFNDVTELEQQRRELEEAMVELQKSRDEIRLQNEELDQLAMSDPLTGVANRRCFMEWMNAQFCEALGESSALCCLMVDIDHFKRVNDEHGHAIGDEIIRHVADALRDEVRPQDIVCRYGGEEFCMVLAGVSLETAVEVAERVRERIAGPGFARIPVSASFGASSMEFGAASPTELINQADQALYASKNSGRNRVTRFDAMAAGD